MAERSGIKSSSSKMPLKLGIISDTHGILRPEAVDALRGCNLIIHAGDIGGHEILMKLKKLCKVVAVRGNVDGEFGVKELKESEIVTAGKFNLYVVHKVTDFLPGGQKEKIDVVIYGHSHKSSIKYRGGTLFFNPGSAGRRRFNLPVSLGIITVRKNTLKPELIEISTK